MNEDKDVVNYAQLYKYRVYRESNRRTILGFVCEDHPWKAESSPVALNSTLRKTWDLFLHTTLRIILQEDDSLAKWTGAYSSERARETNTILGWQIRREIREIGMELGVIERWRLTGYMCEIEGVRGWRGTDSALLGYYTSPCVTPAQCHGLLPLTRC